VEHEAELVLVIGRLCRRVAANEAWKHVFGVTCGNDVTARDLQRRDGQWTRGKGFDTFCPLGPYLVAGIDEDQLDDLAVTCRVNGELRQEGWISQLIFPLAPGVVRQLGHDPGARRRHLHRHPAGVGPLIEGDQVEVAVDGVGVLANPVVKE